MPLTLAARVADLLQCQTIPITDTPPTDTATVQLVSTRINGPDTISVVVLRCPHLIPSDILDKIFKICSAATFETPYGSAGLVC